MDLRWDACRYHVRRDVSEDVLRFHREADVSHLAGARYGSEGGHRVDAVERGQADVRDRGEVEVGGPSEIDRGTRASRDNDCSSTVQLKTEPPASRLQARRR
ncbi:hypothetical protein LMG29542_04886 [Paraburkholderia humisilvae]|uniref:Uncharacterized protein n=1 Tax=Paraburkholderia humisilvae TaxID=627669 RepID=A0A6J5EDP7_9BURK|nr:hypothetical protein LMG29542_04886 [Paraburkholderia humisilvae]